MRKIYLSLIVALCAISGFGQVSGYTFSQSTTAYTPITGGTVLATATSSSSLDDLVYNIPNGSFPFAFNFNGTTYTGCNVSTNGFLTFGATAPTTTNYQAIASNAGYSGVIAAWSRDINGIFQLGTPQRTSEIRWQVVGTAPNREIVIQWQDFRAAYDVSTSNVYVQSFQARLAETSNLIRIVYSGGQFLLGSTAINGASSTAAPQVGLRGANNSDYNDRTNNNSVAFTASTAGASNAATQFFNTNTTPPGMPSAGLTYTFTPPACGTPTGITVSAITTSTATVNWTAPSPAPAGGYVYEVRTSGAPGSGATGLVQTNTTAAGVTTANLTGLTQNTAYSVYVRSVCTPGPVNSFWSAATTFNTLSCAPSITQSPATICPGQVQTITATGPGGSTQTFSSGAINFAIPDNTPAGATTAAIVVPAGTNLSIPGGLKVRVNLAHTWAGDLIFRLNSPCGQTFLFDRLDVPNTAAGNSMNFNGIYEFDLSAATVLPEVSLGTGVDITPGSYKPSDVNGNAHNWAGLTFPCAAAGNWTLTVSDNAILDQGTLFDWSLVISNSVTTNVIFAPATGLFTNPAATTPYVAGTPTSVVYASPANTTNYTATDPSCPTGVVPFTVTVNPVTQITTQPANSPVICSGGSTTFTVAATGAGTLTYQWQLSTDGGATWNNLANAAPYAGVTTNTLTVGPVTTLMNNYRFRVIVTGGCGTQTSSQASLTVDPLRNASYTITPINTCSPGSYNISGTAADGLLNSNVLASSGTINLAIPDNTPAGINTAITAPAYSFTAAADLRVRLRISHTWVGDLKLTLTSPCGTTFLMDRPGVPPSTVGNLDNFGTSNVSPNPPSAVYIWDVNAGTVIPETTGGAGFIAAGSYRPSDVNGAAHNWAGLTFPCSAAGTWTLNLSDNGAGDLGTLVQWEILAPTAIPGNYTHTLTGPGTIVQNAPTGANNSTGNFSITNIPAGNNSYTLTSTDPNGCSVSQVITGIIVNQTPTVSITPSSPTLCAGSVLTLVGGSLPSSTPGATFTSTGTITIPATGTGSAAGDPANPYPVNLVVTGVPAGATVQSVRLNGFAHTFPSDVDVVLQSPNGTNVVLMSDAGDGTDATGQSYTFDDNAAALMGTAGLNPTGTYKPTNVGATDNYAAPLPATITQATPTLASFTGGTMNGTWKLFIVDDAGGDAGTLTSFTITFTAPAPVVFSPLTNIFTDPAATIPYTGQPINTVYVNPTSNTTYTATATNAGCTATATVNVTVNQLPAITTQPTPATQTLCPGFNATYTVAATGAGPLTYQWQFNLNGNTSFVNIPGATSPTLNINNVSAANNGTYRVIVSGACPSPATSNVVTLNVGSAPVISTQPANRTVCENGSTTFTVGTTGTPTPNIFQWQVSTDGGATWTNLTTNGSFTSTYSIPVVALSMNNNRYRVIVTNSCNQSTTSSAAILTVNPSPTVTAAPLPARICISDTLIALGGSPGGGTWSGIGVSGFNFVPSATAVGTYTLTYSFTNAQGCTNTATTVAKVEDCPERARLLRDDAIILYPNPNNGQFNIRINSTLYNYIGMKVYNAQGQLVNGNIVSDVLISPSYGGLVYGRVIPINLSKLPAGIYIVKFYYDDGVRTAEKGFKVVIGAH